MVLYYAGIHQDPSYDIKSISIQFDDRFSDVSRQVLEQHISLLVRNNVNNFGHIINGIQQQYEYIEKVDVHFVAPSTLKVVFLSHVPLCVINENLLLLTSGILTQRDYYVQTALVDLPLINVDPSQLSTCSWSTLVACISSIDRQFFDRFSVSYDDQCQLIFNHTVNPRCSLVCRSDFEFKNLKLYEKAVFTLIEQRKSIAQFENIAWTADLRFEKQIILKNNR